MFNPDSIKVRPNVPDELREKARKEIESNYAHIAALDDCMKELLDAVKESGIEKNTIFVFTSDHGDMLYSHGEIKKQKLWDESLIVPFLLRYPEKLGNTQKQSKCQSTRPILCPHFWVCQVLKFRQPLKAAIIQKL
jgi:arylsulfatase A-like enzyme